ncbi:peptidase M4 [Brevibacillus nitrificans]|uniref:Peptidase M4 n=1 Tax=Brevibacillus nitrificans TaxID=651560 RepID=A0A3M8DJ17_9BACL|nr:PepSY domain-containing protein [Brevibacillus nitrificans]RNB87589.1 peptidase M4 [Brevibacillus nitrificans]
MKKARKKQILIPLLCGLAWAFAGNLVTHAYTSPAPYAHAIDQPVQQPAITVEQAKTIALQQVKGRVIHVDLDRDNGVWKYEVIVLTDQNEVYEVEINANTGQVIQVEKEND